MAYLDSDTSCSALNFILTGCPIKKGHWSYLGNYLSYRLKIKMFITKVATRNRLKIVAILLLCTMGISKTGSVKLAKRWVVLVANSCRLQKKPNFYMCYVILKIIKFRDVLIFATTLFASSELVQQNYIASDRRW